MYNAYRTCRCPYQCPCCYYSPRYKSDFTPQHPYGTFHETKADAETAELSRGCFYQNEQKLTRQTREFTLSELAQYNGAMGKPAYVAVNGIVYDVSSVINWSGGTHHGLIAGKDLSSQFKGCHGDNRLSKLPRVGVLKG